MTATIHHSYSADARWLRRKQAAAYCGLSPSSFDAKVKAGLLPQPSRVAKVWDRYALDAALNGTPLASNEIKSDYWTAYKNGEIASQIHSGVP